MIWLVLIFLFIITFFSTTGAGIGSSAFHYGFFIGPIFEILHGHSYPLTLDLQYGWGLTAFLAVYYKLLGSVTLLGMQNLLKILAFLQYSLIFFIASALYQSRKIALLALGAILFFNFYSQGDLYYTCPSIGFLRFGFIYLILFTWVCEGKWISEKSSFIIVSILGSLSFVWSFESAVYTLPALFFAEYIQHSFKKFLPIFLACFSCIILAYLAPMLFYGQWPELWRYYEYPLLYASGFGQVPLTRYFNAWWFFPLLYGFLSIKIISGSISNRFVSALTVYGMLLFTYYGGRAEPNNLFHVAIPFILLSIYLVINLNPLTKTSRQVLLAMLLVAYCSIEMAWDSHSLVAENIWKKNLPLLKHSLLTLAADRDSQLNVNACIDYQPLYKYIENNSIALISDDENIYRFYDCTKTHNAFGLNPYAEIAINPKATQRIAARATASTNKFLLVDAQLIQHKTDRYNSHLATSILESFATEKIGELKIGATTFVLLRNQKIV